MRLKDTTNKMIEMEIEMNRMANLDREIRSTRIFKTPRDMVFSLWTDVAHLSKWWGPNGFTLTSSAFEFKPGGTWEFILHGPDGVDYRNKIRYQTIKAPERIEYEHVNGPVHRVIVLFEEYGNETMVHFRMIFETSTLRDQVASQFHAVEGLEQTLSRLEQLTASKVYQG